MKTESRGEQGMQSNAATVTNNVTPSTIKTLPQGRMTQESLVVGTISEQINNLAEKNKLSEFVRYLATAMSVNSPKSVMEAYDIIDDVCQQISEKYKEEWKAMQTTELILSAAAKASVTPDGSPCRFTLKDVKRELTHLTNTAEKSKYAVSEGSKKIAAGPKISHELASRPELYTTIYDEHERRRIIGFYPVSKSQKSHQTHVSQF